LRKRKGKDESTERRKKLQTNMADALADASHWADEKIYFYLWHQRIVGCHDDQSQQSSSPWLVSQPITAS